jgi:hypothetical protein
MILPNVVRRFTAGSRSPGTRVLTTALDRLEADGRENGLSRQWEAFDDAVIAPA